MHPNHARSVSDLLEQARDTPEWLHVESGKMDGEEAMIVAAVGPMARYLRRMVEAEARAVKVQTTLGGGVLRV